MIERLKFIGQVVTMNQSGLKYYLKNIKTTLQARKREKREKREKGEKREKIYKRNRK
jgi:uncharacterized protein YaiI (UPF0178 family)